MKAKQIKKSILLFIILFVGVALISGCSSRKEREFNMKIAKEREAAHQERLSKVDTDKRNKYEELGEQVGYGINKIETLEIRRNLERTQFDIKNGYSKEAIFKGNEKTEKIDIEIARLRKRISTIQDEQRVILEESEKSCFPKNTKVVMHDGSLKSIDTITKGDKVMIYDIANDSIGTSSVNEKYIDNNNHMYILNNSIQATSYERFLTQDGWKRMNSISTTDSVFNGNSFVNVDSMSKVKKDLTVYNLNINSTHNFFVSYGQENEWFLIHNTSGGGSSGGGGK